LDRRRRLQYRVHGFLCLHNHIALEIADETKTDDLHSGLSKNHL
jgi:hypothetical protein